MTAAICDRIYDRICDICDRRHPAPLQRTMIDSDLLKILCCPETHQALQPAPPALVELLNQQIDAGTAKNRGGRQVREPIDAGLVRADGSLLYPIRRDLPLLLVDEAILLKV